jgi:hypothetical protein
VQWTAIEILPAEDGLPALFIPNPDRGTPHFAEYSLLVLCIRGSEQSWFANLGKSAFVETLRWQRGRLVRPYPASGIVCILGKYIQRGVLLAYRIHLKLRYDGRMKSNPKTADTPFAKFTRAMDGLMRVPHSEIKKALAEEKQANAGKPKRGPKPKHSSASDRASGNED